MPANVSQRKRSCDWNHRLAAEHVASSLWSFLGRSCPDLHTGDNHPDELCDKTVHCASNHYPAIQQVLQCLPPVSFLLGFAAIQQVIQCLPPSRVVFPIFFGLVFLLPRVHDFIFEAVGAVGSIGSVGRFCHVDSQITLDEWKLLGAHSHADRPDGRARVQFGVVIGRRGPRRSRMRDGWAGTYGELTG